MINKDKALYHIKNGVGFVGVYREKALVIFFYKTIISIHKSEGESLELTFNSIDEAIKFVDMKYGLDNLFFY